MYRHILIATDGSERATKGVQQGLALAGSLQAKATVLTVSEPISTGFDDALGWSAVATSLPDFQNARDEAACKVLDGVTALASAAGIVPQLLHVADRYAAEAIVDTAEQQGCDLIVMATLSHGALLGRLQDSVSHAVVRHSRTPVLLVPHVEPEVDAEDLAALADVDD